MAGAGRSPRKLAVILHADVVGSTALVRLNEALAHERFQDVFLRLTRAIEAYGGIAHEVRGDALVAEFNRASDAVCAALVFQDGNTQFKNTIIDGVRPELRIGIALGEVIVADNTLTGEGVVLAQRLEQLAKAGTVCIQGSIYEAVPGRLPFDYRNLGEQEVKGFVEPVRAYEVTARAGEALPEPEHSQATVSAANRRANWPWFVRVAAVPLIVVAGIVAWLTLQTPTEEPASIERMAFPLPDKPSIAVLPFTNMSGDPEQEYFVDGMTEDLITDLSKLSGLFVIARNSVFTYKGKAVKIAKIAEELGVRYVLEGSVRRAGDQVRINAQLIDATTGGHLWAERYDDTLTNVFSLQDQVTDRIVKALAVSLTVSEEVNKKVAETKDPKAYDAFLQGWERYRQGSPESLRESIVDLEQATQRDPLYSRAHAALAAVYWRIYSNLWYEQVLGAGYSFQALEKAREYLKEAMKSPTPVAYQVAAEIHAHASDIFLYGPIVQAEGAIALDPNDPAGHLAMATALLKAGRAEEAEQSILEAMRLDPIYPTYYLVHLGQAEFAMGRYAEAAATFERAEGRDAGNHRTYIYLVATYGHLGRHADAANALGKANELRAEAGWGEYSLSSVDDLLWVGDPTTFTEGLRMAGVAHEPDWSQLVRKVAADEAAVSSRYEIEGATLIDEVEARELHGQDVPFVDVSKHWYREHIPGAELLMIWFTGDSEFNEVRLARIAKREQPIVIYSSSLEKRAVNACAKAVAWGFKRIYYFADGLKKWKAAGYTLAADS